MDEPKSNGNPNWLNASPWTAIKQNIYAEGLRVYVAIANAIQKRHYWAGRWFYFDLTSGSGLINNGGAEPLEGSPLISLREFQAKGGFEVDCLFCEQDQARAAELDSILQGLSSQWSEHEPKRIHYKVEACDHGDLFKRLNIHNNYGLLYWDGMGGDIFPTGALSDWLKQHRFHDLLVMASGTAPKRRGTPRLDQLLKTVPRKYMWLSEPNGRWEWIFALFSNWSRVEQTGRGRLIRHDSYHGQEILNKLATTAEERKASQEKFQLQLFDQ